MTMLVLEYRHTAEPEIDDPTIRRRTTGAMAQYMKDLIDEMRQGDISCSFKETVVEKGPNTVLINGRTVADIIEGLQIKMLDADESCDLGKTGIVTFGRPTLDWKREYIEDVPDTIMKNAIAKTFADLNSNRLPVVDQ